MTTRLLLIEPGGHAPEYLLFEALQVVDFPALVGADVPCDVCHGQLSAHMWQLAVVDGDDAYRVESCSETGR